MVIALEHRFNQEYLTEQYWNEVRETRCPECGLCFGIHMDDCSYNEVE